MPVRCECVYDFKVDAVNKLGVSAKLDLSLRLLSKILSASLIFFLQVMTVTVESRSENVLC